MFSWTYGRQEPNCVKHKQKSVVAVNTNYNDTHMIRRTPTHEHTHRDAHIHTYASNSVSHLSHRTPTFHLPPNLMSFRPYLLSLRVALMRCNPIVHPSLPPFLLASLTASHPAKPSLNKCHHVQISSPFFHTLMEARVCVCVCVCVCVYVCVDTCL